MGRRLSGLSYGPMGGEGPCSIDQVLLAGGLLAVDRDPSSSWAPARRPPRVRAAKVVLSRLRPLARLLGRLESDL
jgi:hypothetical protein